MQKKRRKNKIKKIRIPLMFGKGQVADYRVMARYLEYSSKATKHTK